MVEAKASAPAQTESSPPVYVGEPIYPGRGNMGLVRCPVVLPIGWQMVACRMCFASIEYLI